MDNTSRLLDEEIVRQLTDLSSYGTGSDDKSKAIDDLVQLYKLRIEEKKIAEARAESETKEANDLFQTKKQLAEQKKDRYFRAGIAAAELILPLIFYGIWMGKGLKFEETGTFTSATFKGLLNRFRPTKD